MKRTTKQMTVAGLFACALAAVSLGAVNFNAASAEVQTNANISMSEKASLRVEQTLDDGTEIPFGLRFKAEINKEWYDGLTNPNVYVLLLPTDMLTEELTKDTDNVLVVGDDEEFKLYDYEGNYRCNTVLTQIPESAYGTEISVRSYITADDLEVPVYSPLTTTYASAARSVVQVADTALNLDIEAQTEQYAALEKYVITGIEATEDRYLEMGSTSNVNAQLSFADGTSDTVKEYLTGKYTFTYESDNEEVVTVNDGALTTVAVGTANIAVSNETLGISTTVKVEVYQRAYGTLVDFDRLDATDYTLAEQASAVSVAEYEGEPAIKISTLGKVSEASSNKVLFMAYSPLALPTWYDKFDTITVKAAWVADVETSQQVLIYNQTSWTSKSGVTFEETIATADLKSNIAKNGTIRMYAQYRYATTYEETNYDIPSSLYIMGLELGINDIEYETGEQAINLYDKFHTETGATFTFTPTGGTATKIDDPTAFAKPQDGVITATISADGYAGTVTANYNYTEVTAKYGEVLDFTNIDANNQLKSQNSAVYEVITLSDGTQVIAFTLQNTVNSGNGGVRIKLPDEYFNNGVCLFDTFSFTCKLVSEEQESTSTTNWHPNGVESSTIVLKQAGDEVTFTGNIDDFKAESTYVKCYVKLKHTSIAVKGTFYITNITLGFADWTIGDTAFSWETYGIDVSELSDVTFNDTAVTDLTTFNPTEAGTIKFTVDKKGYLPTTFEIKVNAAA